MTNNKDLQFAKTLATYKGKWVAFNLEEHRIIASGRKLQEVQDQVEKNNEKDYVFHLVPSKPLAMGAI